MKKTISIIMTAVMLLCITAAGASAARYDAYGQLDQTQWNDYFNDVSRGFGLCELTPGSDQTQMNFSWHSSAQYEPCVNISVNSDMSGCVSFTGTSVSVREGAYVNRVSASALEPDTQYYYTYGDPAAPAAVQSFETGNGEDFTFLYMGDVHVANDDANPEQLVNTSAKWSNTLSGILNADEEIDFAVSVGDQASAGLGSEMAAFYAARPLRSLPIATVIGNHEKKAYDYGYYGNKPNEFNGMGTSFIGGDNWFRYGNVLFLVLDSTNGSGIDHYDFVSEAVEKNPDAVWRICLLHHDLYGGAYSTGDKDNQLIAKVLNPVFEDFDIDFVLQGHSHYYGRTHGLVNGDIVEYYTDVEEITDPRGTIFMVSGSVNRVQYETYPQQAGKEIVKNCIVNDVLYTTVNVSGNTLKLTTRTYSDGQTVDELTVNKTEENSFDDAKTPSVITLFIGFAGTLYTVFDKLLKLFRSISIG